MAVKEYDNGKLITYTIEELIEQLEMPIIDGRDDSSDDNDYGFSLTHSFKEAKDLMIKGDVKSQSKILEIKSKLDYEMNSKESIKVRSRADVAGYSPIVANAVMGLPKSMINSYRVPVKNKIVDIYINHSVGAIMSAETIEFRGAYILSYIDHLEQNGYRVNLFAGAFSYNMESDDYSGFYVKVKSASQPLNTLKAAFYAVHPSFLRRIYFRILENESRLDDKTHSGYGQATNFSQQRDLQNKMLGEDVIILDKSIDLDEDKSYEENIKELEKFFS